MNPDDTSKKRRWPLGIRIVLLFLGAGLLGTGIVFFLGVAATARWDRYAASLRENGDPLTFAEVQAARAVIPDEENGALVIDRLHDRLEELSKASTGGPVLVFPGHARDVDFFTGIRRENIQPSRDFLDSYRDLHAELSVLRNMMTGRFEVTYDPATQSIMSVLLPELATLRAASKLQYLHGVLQLVDGNVAGAAESAKVQLAFGATLNEHPTVIGRLVQMAVDALGVHALENLLRVGEIDAAALREFANTLETRKRSITFRWAFAGERAFFLGVCDELIGPTNRQIIDVMPEVALFANLPDALIRENQMRGVEILTWLVDAKDDPEKLVAATQRMEREIPKLTLLHGILKTIMPNLSRAVILHLRITAELDCTIAGLAAERYRLATGKMPESLDALVPAYLDEVPTDPFDGEPMRFAVTDEGIVVYSVNDDLRDDGGIVAKRKKQPPYLDVGFRLNRPEHRGLILLDTPTED